MPQLRVLPDIRLKICYSYQAIYKVCKICDEHWKVSEQEKIKILSHHIVDLQSVLDSHMEFGLYRGFIAFNYMDIDCPCAHKGFVAFVVKFTYCLETCTGSAWWLRMVVDDMLSQSLWHRLKAKLMFFIKH